MSQIQQYRNTLYCPLDFFYMQNHSYILPVIAIEYLWRNTTIDVAIIDIVINEAILKHKNKRYNSSIFNEFY